MADTYKRTIIKSISWRILAILITCITIFIITGSFTFSVAISLIDAIIKTTIYFIHERAWAKINIK